MSGYNRFVAYVYEYQQEKKGPNRGFLKVELRNSRCSIEIHLKIPALASGLTCKVYGFIRTSGKLNGVLLGQCSTQKDSIQGTLELQEGKMGKGGFSLSDLNGMILLTESNGFYGTEWDDQPILPGQFLEQEPEVSAALPVQEDTVPQGNPEPSLPETPVPPKENPPQERIPSPQTLSPSDSEPESAAGSESSTDSGPDLPPEAPAQEPMQMETEEVKEASSCNLPLLRLFDDDEIVECRKITHQDFPCLHRRDWALKNNRFLLYGYYNFGHLIIGRRSSDGQYILGVPGICDQQERFMANMFGFPHFKASRSLEIPQGRGGYWYRCIYPPSFH